MKDTGSICYINNVVTQEFWSDPQYEDQPWFSRVPMRLTLWPGGRVATTRDIAPLAPTDQIEDGWRIFHHWWNDKLKLYRVREEDYQRLLGKTN